MEPFEAPLTKCKCHAAAQTSAVGCNQTQDWQCKHQPRQHEIRQYVLENICSHLENIFRRSHSCIFVEVDYSAASVVLASLRHAVEDVMEANISKRKLCYGPTNIYYPLSSIYKVQTNHPHNLLLKLEGQS